MFSPANRNELFSVELSRAWELAYRRVLVEIRRAKSPTVVFLAVTPTDDARLEFV